MAPSDLTFTARSVNIAELPSAVFDGEPDGEVPDDWLETPVRPWCWIVER